MISKFGVVAFLIFCSTMSTVYGQQLDPASRWATIAANEYGVFPDIVYKRANGQDLKLDVITRGPSLSEGVRPGSGAQSHNRPTLIYIHGGGWVHGSKEIYGWWALPFVARGMNLVNVEYRMANVSLAPAAVEDCRCALRWVYRHAKEYGFDTTKLVVAGHSAGGHLALITGMLGPSSEFDNSCAHALGHDPLKVAAIVNFFGITDVVDVLEGPHRQDWAVEWFGSLPNRMELAKKLSPISYVNSGLPPIITLHGELDGGVPYPQAVRLHQALDRVGVPNQLVTVPGGGHGGWTREQNLMVQEAIFSFLEKQGVLSSGE